MMQLGNFVCLLTKATERKSDRAVIPKYFWVPLVTKTPIEVINFYTEFSKLGDILFNAGRSGYNFNHLKRYYTFVKAIS